MIWLGLAEMMRWLKGAGGGGLVSEVGWEMIHFKTLIGNVRAKELERLFLLGCGCYNQVSTLCVSLHDKHQRRDTLVRYYRWAKTKTTHVSLSRFILLHSNNLVLFSYLNMWHRHNTYKKCFTCLFIFPITIFPTVYLPLWSWLFYHKYHTYLPLC